MAKALTGRGRHTVLPIVGDTLVELRLEAGGRPAFVFGAAGGGESELTVEGPVRLRRGEYERPLRGARPGPGFDPRGLAPLVELLGGEVRDAVAGADGRLRVAFANGMALEVAPAGPGEGWEFRRPRPARRAGGRGRPCFLAGAPGRLVFAAEPPYAPSDLSKT